MSDQDGSLVLPRKITLGNALSIASTVVVGAFGLGMLYILFGNQGDRISKLEAQVEALPSVYAQVADLHRVEAMTGVLAEDQKGASHDIAASLGAMTKAQGDLTAAVAAQGATLEAVRGDVSDIKSTLARRTALDETRAIVQAMPELPARASIAPVLSLDR